MLTNQLSVNKQYTGAVRPTNQLSITALISDNTNLNVSQSALTISNDNQSALSGSNANQPALFSSNDKQQSVGILTTSQLFVAVMLTISAYYQ